MNKTFEEKVLVLLQEILQEISGVREQQDQIEEALRNVSTPGGDFRVFEED